MFNLQPQVQVVPFFDGHQALVVDNGRQDPQRSVASAAEQQAHFSPLAPAYPVMELWLAEDAELQMAGSLAQDGRCRFRVRPQPARQAAAAFSCGRSGQRRKHRGPSPKRDATADPAQRVAPRDTAGFIATGCDPGQ